MKRALLVGALLLSACDPGVQVQFLVAAAGDDSTAQQSAQIAASLAQRHDLKPNPLESSCDVASFHSRMSPTSWLDFCVDQKPQSVSIVLSEFITTDWGPRGDSLRHELDDTLRIRFGDRVTRIDSP